MVTPEDHRVADFLADRRRLYVPQIGFRGCGRESRGTWAGREGGDPQSEARHLGHVENGRDGVSRRWGDGTNKGWEKPPTRYEMLSFVS